MRSILIIEDNENLSRGISFLFEKDGFQTHVAPDLAAGRSILREQSFDLLILDLGLPDGDGIHSAQNCESTPIFRSLYLRREIWKLMRCLA